MYHRLGPVRRKSIVPGHYVTARRLDHHLRVLRILGKQSISLAQLHRGFRGEQDLPPNPVVITFDDGYQSFADIGMPLLRKYSQKATVFLVSDFVGGKNEWDMAKGDVEEPLLARETILGATGFEFGSHTLRHADLTAVAPELAQNEIQRSREELASWLNQPVDYFCYPYGHQNADVRRWVHEAGYLGATSTRRGGNGPSTDPFDWGRLNVRVSTSGFRLLRQLLGMRKFL